MVDNSLVIKKKKTTTHIWLSWCLYYTGTTGARCETDIDTECQTNPCQNGGVCLNRINDYLCVCPVTFTGKK